MRTGGVAGPPEGVRRLCVVGLGLIGASFARALRANGFDGAIDAVVRSERAVEWVRDADVVDRVDTDLATLAAEADVVLLAVPMLAMPGCLEALRSAVGEGAIITDAGSVKGAFVDDARRVFGSLRRVVPGHPIAGSEQSGPEASRADLFVGRRVLLTPGDDTDRSATDTIASLWTLAGAEVECLTPAHHDRVLAATSHLPHVLAYALVDALARQQEAEEIFRYAAGGFRDFTRIAASDAIMWRDICLTNGPAILDALDRFDGHLAAMRAAIADGDADGLQRLFERARHARQRYSGDV